MGISNDKMWEMDALEYSFELMLESIFKGPIELLKAVMGNGTDYYEAYAGYSDLYRKSFYSEAGFKLVDSKADNRPLVVSLILHASTLNPYLKVERLKLIEISENSYSDEKQKESMALANYQASSLNRSIAIIYRHGLLGEDIDPDKYEWYINKSIHYDTTTDWDPTSEFKTRGLGSLALGYDYPNGFLTTGVDREKAKEAWIQGAKNLDLESLRCLAKNFLEDKGFNKTFSKILKEMPKEVANKFQTNLYNRFTKFG